MSFPWKPLLARALCALVLIPLLLNYGFGMIVVSGTEPLYFAILVFSLPWVWAIVVLALLCACGPRCAGRALRFALLGRRPLDCADELGRIAEALALAARMTLAMGFLWWAAEATSSLASIDAQFRGGPVPHYPERLARGVSSLVLAPLGALLLGHLWLGQAAEAARRASGSVSTAPLLGAWAGASVLVFIVVPIQILLAMFVRFS